jgi:hypothetical protein
MQLPLDSRCQTALSFQTNDILGGCLMIVLRIIGILLVLLGLLACVTLIFFIPGMIMIVVGAILVAVSRKPRAVVVNVNNSPSANS